MAPEKPAVAEKVLDGAPVSEQELDTGIAYARKKYGREVNRDLLRLAGNTALANRKPGSILPALVSDAVRKVVPYAQWKDAKSYEAYKGAAMKIFSERSARKRQSVASRHRLIREAQAPPKKGQPFEDTRPKHKGQFKLL